MPMPGGQPRGRGGGGWVQVELADALDPSQIEPPILSLYLVVPFFFSLIRYCFLCCFFFSFHQGLIQTSLTELGTSD